MATGTDILNRVEDTLQDTTNVRWSDAELLRYINDAQREIANLKPEASAKTDTVTLATGTRQTLPNDGLRLIKATRMMSDTVGNSGTGKRAVRLVDLDILNSQDPDWHDPDVTGVSAHGTNIKHYAFDADDPKTFFVYPGVSGSAYLEIVYSKSPTDLASASSTIDLDDIYLNPIADYVLYRAYQKDAEFAGNAQRAGSHYQLFNASLGAGTQAKSLINPSLDYNLNKAVT
jgi:hypothetical protein